MINNPCTWFIDGSDTKSFCYERGAILYNFSPYDSGLSKTMEMNLIFFANSEEHAKNVLTRMLKYGIQCIDKYDKYYETNTDYCQSTSIDHKLETYNYLLLNRDKWTFTKVKTNQFLKSALHLMVSYKELLNV